MDQHWTDEPDESARQLERVTVRGQRPGAVVTGPAVDRRHTIEAALSPVPPGRTIYYLHGSQFAASTPYGVLSILLSELPEGGTEDRHALVRSLAEHLRGQLGPDPTGSPAHGTDGAPAMVILSQPEQIDPDSASVLAQLTHLRLVTLLVHCERQTDLPDDLAALLRAGMLLHVHVRPLSPRGVNRVMERLLEGTVSSYASTAVWGFTGGVAGQVATVVSDSVSSGKLVRAESCWVMAPGRLPAQAATGFSAWEIRGLPARQRALLEMVALCGPIPVTDLAQNGSAADLDALVTENRLELRTAPEGRVAVVPPMVTAGVLAAIDPDRRRELGTALGTIDPGLRNLTRMAETMLAVGDDAGARELSEQTLASTVDGAEVRNQSDTSTTVWQDHGDGAAPEGRHRDHARVAEARILTAAGAIDRAAELLRDAPDTACACVHALAAQLALDLGAVEAARRHLGQMRPSASGRAEERHCPARSAEVLYLLREVLEAETLALTDDQDGARRTLAAVVAELEDYRTRGILQEVLSPGDRTEIALSMLATLCTCADMDAAGELAARLVEGHHGHGLLALRAELALAGIEAVTGDVEAARERADRSAAQAQALERCPEARTARAIQAYCLCTASADRSAFDSIVLADKTAADSPAPGRLDWFTELLWGVGMAVGISSAAGTSRLQAQADRARAAGLVAVEFHALAAAVRHGRTGLAPRLHRAAAATQTPWSQLHRDLAATLLERDADALARALTELAAAGLMRTVVAGEGPLLADLSGHHVRQIAQTVAERRTTGSGTARMQTTTGAAQPGAGTPSWVRPLTPRERQVARLVVEGATNASIARSAGISIRTVEGHLYQIYTKLQLNGRSELVRLAQTAPDLQAVE